jgi:predicted dehydrogenase
LLANKEIDAVLIANGDRWHAPAAILAAEAGKDIYCETPCGLTIDYCQRLDETIRKTGRVFQAGTQRRSVTNYQQAVRMVHDGKLGRLSKMIAAALAWVPQRPLKIDPQTETFIGDEDANLLRSRPQRKEWA